MKKGYREQMQQTIKEKEENLKRIKQEKSK